MNNGEYKLKTMIVDELPLIAFTTCAPAALGVAFVALMEGIVAFSSTGLWFGGWRFAALAVVFTTVGMLASVMHLAKPLRAPRSLANVKSSWLSREILAVSAFWGILVVWLVFALIASGTLPFARVDAFTALVLGWLSLCTCTIACVVGLLLVFVIARAYRVMGQPGWNGPETLFELLAVALRVGVVAACCLVLLAAEYMDVPLSPWIAALISIVCIGIAAALDKYASNARMHRLSLEIDTGANPHGRVPAALSCVVTWQAERGYGFALELLGGMLHRARLPRARVSDHRRRSRHAVCTRRTGHAACSLLWLLQSVSYGLALSDAQANAGARVILAPARANPICPRVARWPQRPVRPCECARPPRQDSRRPCHLRLRRCGPFRR